MNEYLRTNSKSDASNDSMNVIQIDLSNMPILCKRNNVIYTTHQKSIKPIDNIRIEMYYYRIVKLILIFT